MTLTSGIIYHTMRTNQSILRNNNSIEQHSHRNQKELYFHSISFNIPGRLNAERETRIILGELPYIFVIIYVYFYNITIYCLE